MPSLHKEIVREEGFREALDQLETAAGTPLVSGEMGNWLEAVQQALTHVLSVVDHQIQQAHAPQLSSIKREDPEMLRNVDQLQKEDRLILEELTAAVARLGVLKPMVERIEPDEKRAEQALAAFGENALQLSLRIKKQEVAMRTWLQEAFNRDRGVAD